MPEKALASLLVMLVIAQFTIAADGQVLIVSFHYDEAGLSVQEQLIKYGYAPGIREGIFTAELIGADSSVIASIPFDIPLNEFTDIADNATGELSGGIIRHNQTDFALVLPYEHEAKEIAMKGPLGKDILRARINPSKPQPKAGGIIVFAALGFMVGIAAAAMLLRKKKR